MNTLEIIISLLVAVGVTIFIIFLNRVWKNDSVADKLCERNPHPYN